MVGEGSVEFEEERDDAAGQVFEDVRHGQAGHAVAGVDRDLERLDRVALDEAEAVLGEVVEHFPAFELTQHLAERADVAARQAVAQRAQAGVERDRLRAVAGELHAVVVGRIVRGRDHDTAGESIAAHGEIERVGRDQADVGHVRAALGRTARQRFEESRARRAHVPADDHRVDAELGDEGAPDCVSRRLVEFGREDAAQIIALEDRRKRP